MPDFEEMKRSVARAIDERSERSAVRASDDWEAKAMEAEKKLEELRKLNWELKEELLDIKYELHRIANRQIPRI
jgi:hypothetical protein